MEYMHLPVMLPSIYDILGALALLFIILVLTVLWKSWKTGKRYAHLPTYHNILFEEGYKFLTRKTNLHQLTRVIFQQMDAICKQFEKEGMVHLWCFRHILLIFDEEAVKIFATDEASADKTPDYMLLKEVFGEGLITSNGETWKKDRKMLNPVFYMAMLKEKIPILNENADILVKELGKITNEPTADLLPFLMHCAADNICESFLDENMKDKERDMDIEKIYKQIKWMQKYTVSRWILPPIVAKLLKFCTPSGWKSLKIFNELNQTGLKMISSAKVSGSHNSYEKDMDLNRKSLLPILLEHQQKDTSLTPKYVQDHIYTLLVAGSDTVVFTIMWCLYLLGLNKEVQKKVCDDIKAVSDGFVTYENLCQLEYLECILKETLRLYPTVPIFARHLKKDVQCGKYTVPKDTTILFFLYRLHRNPEIYPDPEKFDPDRFLSTNAGKRKWAHLPFSEGYRNCIGKKFAMMEMKVILAHIIRNYEITSFDRREDLELCWDFILLPNKPLRMHITPRHTLLDVPCKTKA